MLDKPQQTAMGAAFNRFGIRSEDAELDVDLAKYRNHSGTFERGLARLKNAFADQLPGEGQECGASNGQGKSAQSRQPVEGEAGQSRRARDGQCEIAPSSSSNRGGEGQRNRASGQLATALPAREPSAAERAAALRVQNASARLALTMLDRTKTSDGKPWGDVGEHELAGMQRDGTLAKAVDDWMGPRSEKQRFKPIRELMNDKQFELVLARVRGQNYAA